MMRNLKVSHTEVMALEGMVIKLRKSPTNHMHINKIK